MKIVSAILFFFFSVLYPGNILISQTSSEKEPLENFAGEYKDNEQGKYKNNDSAYFKRDFVFNLTKDLNITARGKIEGVHYNLIDIISGNASGKIELLEKTFTLYGVEYIYHFSIYPFQSDKYEMAMKGDIGWDNINKHWVLTYRFGLYEDGRVRMDKSSLRLYNFYVNLTNNKLENKKESKDCNCDIIVPDDLKPGKDFYVKVKRDGCVSSDKVLYNNKDNPITNWDGNSVEVTLQYTCCDTHGHEKKLTVPKYGSEEFNKLVKKHTELIYQEKPKGKLPSPKPKELLAGTTIALLLSKVLQILLSGKGNTSSVVPPPNTPKPPSVPPQKHMPEEKKDIKKEENTLKEIEPKKEELKKEAYRIEEQNKQETKEPVTDVKKELSQQEKQIRMKELQVRQNKLLEEANSENHSLTSSVTLAKHMFQTIPASINEVKELGHTVVKAKEKMEEEFDGFMSDIIANPKERARLTNNLHQMTLNAFNYADSGNLRKDALKLGNKIIDSNIEFVKKLAADPKKTMTDYLTTSFGTENFSKAFDHNNGLGNRLLNLGTGYFKTFTMFSTGGTGVNVLKNIATGQGLTLNNLFKSSLLVFKHQTNLGAMKLHEKFPQLQNDFKKVLLKEYVKLKADNMYNVLINKPDETTTLHNMNDYLEKYDKYLSAPNG